MKDKLVKRLFDINIALSREKNIFILFEKIVSLARELSNADAGTLYMLYNNKLYFSIVQTESLNVYINGEDGRIDWPPVPLYREDGTQNRSNVSAVTALDRNMVVIADCYTEPNYDFSGTKKFDEMNNYRTKSMIVVPLKSFEGEIVGVLQLINKIDKETGKITEFTEFDQEGAKALASQATVSILNARYLQELEKFLDAFMKSLGEVVDAKSPYTGNHVKKVGKFAKMVYQTMGHKRYRNVEVDRDSLRLLEIASWLHDVGKIAVPNHVMDKATKLETVFDRIDAIADRFEIVKRDIEISYLKGEMAENEYIQEIEQLDKDLQFLREINSGDTFMSDDKLERLQQIAKRRYILQGKEVALLRDDEVYNLSIRKGTLTKEEREIIMSHAEMTYKMLEKIPFPKKFEKAKNIASNHHEKLNGKGYPRGLNSEQLSLEDRILAVADVFEALSSADRPYKSPKKLSEIFKILSFMVKDGDIDGDIVRFIFENKIYLDFAKEEMLPEQIDEPKLYF